MIIRTEHDEGDQLLHGMTQIKRPYMIVIMGAILVQMGMMLFTWDGGYRICVLNYDDAPSYQLLAKSMAEGRGYTRSPEPDYYVAHTHYPPGVPAMMVPGRVIGGGPGRWLDYAWMGIMALLATCLTGLIASRLMRPLAVGIVLCLMILNPVYHHLTQVMMTEIPSVFFMMLCLWLSIKAYECMKPKQNMDTTDDPDEHTQKNMKKGVILALMASLTLGTGLLFKGTLLPIIPAMLFAFCVKGRWKKMLNLRAFILLAGVFFLALFPTVLWMWRNSLTDATGYEGLSHVQETLAGGMYAGPVAPVSRFVQIVTENLKWFFADRFLDSLAGAGWTWMRLEGYSLPAWLRIIVLLLAGGLSVSGVSKRFVWVLILVTMTVTIGLLAIRYNGGAVRFWVTVWPLFLILMCSGVQRIADKFDQWSSTKIKTGQCWIAVLLIMASIWGGLQMLRFPSPTTDAKQAALNEYVQQMHHISQVVQEGDAVFSPIPEWAFVITGSERQARLPEDMQRMMTMERYDDIYLVLQTEKGIEVLGREQYEYDEYNWESVQEGVYFKTYRMRTD